MREDQQGGRWRTWLALCLLLPLSCDTRDRALPPPVADVVLIILDTTRADHLSSYGYEELTTPNLDRLSREGTRYTNAWAQAPWTLPAIATILTGEPPHVHGAGRYAGSTFAIRDDLPTLAEQMTGRGYRSAAFINVVWCSPELSSLDRGFGRYDFATSDASNVGQRNAEETTTAAIEWLDEIGEDPAFLVVHYFDPHLSYDPPEPFDGQFGGGIGLRVPPGFGSAGQVFGVRDGRIELDERERKALIARYDGELAFTDAEFGRLRAALEDRGRWDDALVIVVADHGEEFWDHGGFEHGHSHHRELLRIPLIVKHPDEAPGQVSADRVRQLEIAPTILAFADLESALPGFVLGHGTAEQSIAEGSLWGGNLYSLRSDEGTLIMQRSSGEGYFYSAGDTGELQSAPLDAAGAALKERLDAVPVPRIQRPSEMTDEQRERLRSLGYLM